MLIFFSIILIISILFFLLIFKRKYIFSAINKKKFKVIKESNNEKKTSTTFAKNSYLDYQESSNNYSKFQKRKLRGKMFKLSKGTPEEKLKALNIAEELADKSILPLLRRGLKDMNPEIVERSASLIRKFK